MALASVSPTVAGSKPKKLLDQTRDVAVEALQSANGAFLELEMAIRGCGELV